MVTMKILFETRQPPIPVSSSARTRGVRATSAMALAPGLARKVKKVLEIPVDSPEILSCLKSLSEFYPENTPAARRGLRRSIERHGLEINREYLKASNEAQEALKAVDGQLERLLESCDTISGALERTRKKTGALLRETAELDAEIAAVEEKKKIIATFAVDFQLADEDVAALEGRTSAPDLGSAPAVPSSTSGHEVKPPVEITDAFFDALDRARAVQGNCRRLLRTRHQRAGLELMDQMASYQERAHERLCRWVQIECRALAEEDGPDVSPLLTKAMTALRRRPTLYRYCVEEVARTRHDALFRRFIAALARGGPGGVPRPIEAHAADPKRYVGDMLGWVHQAAAGEKELFAALLGSADGDSNSNETFPAEVAEEADAALDAHPEKVLDRVLDGVRRPFRMRVDQALQSLPGQTEVARHGLASVFGFYESVFASLVGDDSGLVATLAECRVAARQAFEEAIARRVGKLKKNPPEAPEDLGAPACVAEATRGVVELLENDGSGADDADQAAAEAVAASLDPVLAACETSADRLASDADASSKHPRWAREAYLVNCLTAMRHPLRSFKAASSFCAALDSRADALARSMAEAEAERLLVRVGMSEVGVLASLYRAGSKTGAAMSRDPGLRAPVVCGALDALVDAVGATDDPAPSFDAVRDPKRRAEARRVYAGKIVEAFAAVFAALLDPRNGYGDVRATMRHGPNALSTLLGGV